MANLLFIGTPTDSIYAMAKAKSLGYGVCGVDGNHKSPGLAWVRKWGCDGAVADIYDFHQIHQAVMRNYWRIDGVLAVGCDVGPVVSIVAQALNLPHISYHVTRLSWDKPALKRVLSQAGIAVPGTADFVTKPVDGRGSRGVSLVSASRLWGAEWELAKANSQAGRVMVEEYVPGPGISAECVVWAGQVVFAGLTDRHYGDNRVVEVGGRGPSVYEGTQAGAACHRLIERIVGVLGVTAGTLKFDFILDERHDLKPVVLEVAIGRIGGGQNVLYLSLAYNVDMYRAMFAVACGQDPRPLVRFASSRYIVTGRYEMLEQADKNADRGKFRLLLTGQKRKNELSTEQKD